MQLAEQSTYTYGQLLEAIKRRDSNAKHDLSSVAKTRSAPEEVVCTFKFGVRL
jgi:hypothetical protein